MCIAVSITFFLLLPTSNLKIFSPSHALGGDQTFLLFFLRSKNSNEGKFLEESSTSPMTLAKQKEKKGEENDSVRFWLAKKERKSAAETFQWTMMKKERNFLCSPVETYLQNSNFRVHFADFNGTFASRLWFELSHYCSFIHCSAFCTSTRAPLLILSSQWWTFFLLFPPTQKNFFSFWLKMLDLKNLGQARNVLCFTQVAQKLCVKNFPRQDDSLEFFHFYQPLSSVLFPERWACTGVCVDARQNLFMKSSGNFFVQMWLSHTNSIADKLQRGCTTLGMWFSFSMKFHIRKAFRWESEWARGGKGKQSKLAGHKKSIKFSEEELDFWLFCRSSFLVSQVYSTEI